MNVIKEFNNSPQYESVRKLIELRKQINKALDNFSYDFSKTQDEQYRDYARELNKLVNKFLMPNTLFIGDLTIGDNRLYEGVLTTLPNVSTLEHRVNHNGWNSSGVATLSADFAYERDESTVSSRSALRPATFSVEPGDPYDRTLTATNCTTTSYTTTN